VKRARKQEQKRTRKDFVFFLLFPSSNHVGVLSSRLDVAAKQMDKVVIDGNKERQHTICTGFCIGCLVGKHEQIKPQVDGWFDRTIDHLPIRSRNMATHFLFAKKKQNSCGSARMYLHILSPSNNGFIMGNVCAECSRYSWEHTHKKSKEQITRVTCSFYVSRRTRLEQTIAGDLGPATSGRGGYKLPCCEDKKNQSHVEWGGGGYVFIYLE
jgi:hypothetical protein